MADIQRIPRAYFEAEFGPVAAAEHEAVIGRIRTKTPAFLVWPEELFDRTDAADEDDCGDCTTSSRCSAAGRCLFGYFEDGGE